MSNAEFEWHMRNIETLWERHWIDAEAYVRMQNHILKEYMESHSENEGFD